MWIKTNRRLVRMKQTPNLPMSHLQVHTNRDIKKTQQYTKLHAAKISEFTVYWLINHLSLASFLWGIGKQ